MTYNITKEELRQKIEEVMKSMNFPEVIPVSATHVSIDGAIVSVKEFDEAMKKAHTEYWEDINKVQKFIKDGIDNTLRQGSTPSDGGRRD